MPNSEQVDLLTVKLLKWMVRQYGKVLVSTSWNRLLEVTVFPRKVKPLQKMAGSTDVQLCLVMQKDCLGDLR